MSYTNPEIEDNSTCNKTIDVENMLISNSEGIYDTNIDIYHSQDLESSSILYMENQSSKPNSWDGTILLIFLFGTDKFVMIGSNNILMLLFRMAYFIRNKVFLGQTKKDILAIVL